MEDSKTTNKLKSLSEDMGEKYSGLYYRMSNIFSSNWRTRRF